jgi:hypothetical protein
MSISGFDSNVSHASRTVDIRPMVPLQPSALALLLFSRMKE